MQVLNESVAELPPIIVHRATMRVIDGVHRLLAARAAGADEIRVRFFDGDEKSAFVVGVRANTAHGLPLSLAERKRAAVRILRDYPEWSDRVIALATGLSARTVSGLRGCSTAEDPRLDSRVGLDGRRRPVSTEGGRRLASEMLTAQPDASIREIARATGISPGTVKDVRDRMDQGLDPVPAQARSAHRAGSRRQKSDHNGLSPEDVAALLRGIHRDPSLRFTDTGRLVLRWLDANAIGSTERERLVADLPAHTAGVIAELARWYAADLTEFAARLEGRPPPGA
ncbi:winged helix-turn-helix transcriptional regulator [Lentzea sp. HUAS12]|nr:winged helix-turn-helix transcriptional regulator [Lentzea sp. HUAS12]